MWWKKMSKSFFVYIWWNNFLNSPKNGNNSQNSSAFLTFNFKHENILIHWIGMYDSFFSKQFCFFSSTSHFGETINHQKCQKNTQFLQKFTFSKVCIIHIKKHEFVYIFQILLIHLTFFAHLYKKYHRKIQKTR